MPNARNQDLLINFVTYLVMLFYVDFFLLVYATCEIVSRSPLTDIPFGSSFINDLMSIFFST